MELLCCLLRFRRKIFQRGPDSEDIVAHRLQGGQARADGDKAFETIPQLIAPHVLGLVPQRVDRIVRAERSVDELFATIPPSYSTVEMQCAWRKRKADFGPTRK